jgi:hypothetical protein
MQYDDRLTPELISRCLRDRRALGLLWGPSRRSHAAVRAIMVTYTPARLFGIRQRNTSARRARRGGWQRGVSISTVRAATRRAGRGIRSPEQRGDQHDRDDHIKRYSIISTGPSPSGADGNNRANTASAPSGASTISGTITMRTTSLECLPGMRERYH